MSRYALKKAETEKKLSEEVATEQLMELLGYYDVDIARIEDEGERQKLERVFDQLRDYIREGKIEVRRGEREKLEVAQNTSSGAQIVYTEVGGPAKLAMDKHPGAQHYARVYALLGSLSSLGSAGIQKLPAKDLAVAEILGSVFLAA